MALDIAGGLKNTSISSNRYVVIEELISNAIDSYLIRKNSERSVPNLSISIELEFFPVSLFEGDGFDLQVTCIDNGAGFGDEQIKAFVTKDSTYKDYLKIQGIGKCKGAGRIQYFHFFRALKIESIYGSEGSYKRRNLEVQEGSRDISEDSFSINDTASGMVETKIQLFGIKKDAYQKHFDIRGIRSDFSAKSVRDYIFVAFLQRFIILQQIVGSFSISIAEVDEQGSHTETINSSELPSPIDSCEIPLVCQHGNTQVNQKLNVTRYSLPSTSFAGSHHEVALCANHALVYSLAKYYLRSNSDRSRPIDGNFELLLIESEILEDKVNEQRDGFNIPKECTSNGELHESVSLQDITESLEDYVYSVLTPRDFDRDVLISSVQNKFGITRSMLNDTNIKIHYGDTEENIAKRVLKKYQEDIVKDTLDIFSLKNELLKIDPRGEGFRERIGEISWKYTSTIKKVDMANLSQLVVRRTSMLEVLKFAVTSMLSCQIADGARKENERIIHNIFFPTGKDSDDSVDHDIWILNEEYHYFEHISSDKPLSSIPWRENQKLFEEDIDKSLEDLFAKNNKDHRLKRPDIAIFNQEGAAIIIEFKAPGVELQEHIPDLVQYARLLAAKSNGKIKKVYGYLIGDCMDESRMPLEYTRFPSGMGYFNTARISNPSTGMQYGELYSEVLFYDQFISRAENRLKIYKEKLSFSAL